MPVLFDSARIAAGYATRRPYFHPHVVGKIAAKTELQGRWNRALDVGCGTGLSTKALKPFATTVCGIDPSLSMLEYARASNPELHFAASPAESLPFDLGSFDVITAAGALDWIDSARFLPEAYRVLRPGGWVAIYDIGDGRTMPHSGSLNTWYEQFLSIYPKPARRRVDPASLQAESFGFETQGREEYEVEFPFSREAYAGYLMTQSNVTGALGQNLTEPAMESWLMNQLEPIFGDRTETVRFRGYILYLRRA